MKQSAIINLGKDINIEVIGVYHRAEPEVGYPATFDIDSIESLEKDLYYLLDWVSSNKNYLEIIESKCIEDIEAYENDFED